jgi:outer membrane receptor protein involved in Fe transport
MRDVGDLYEPITGRPMHAFAGYGQLTTGALLGRRVELTAGGRLDLLRYRYQLADEEVAAGGYRRFSPRLAAVVRPTEHLTVKAMAATAFRLPTPVELFASHSTASAGNPVGLAAERQRNYELATDWAPTSSVRLRANAFYVEDGGLIDYAPGDGELRNLYDNQRIGLESELTFAVERGRLQADGWLSYAYNRLLDEQVRAELSTEDRITWVPAHVAKVGARVVAGGWRGTVQVYAQGRTHRRQTDMATPELAAARPTSIAPWVDADVTIVRQLGSHLRLGVRVTGLLDRRAAVPATRDVGFDYRVERREAFVSLEAVE